MELRHSEIHWDRQIGTAQDGTGKMVQPWSARIASGECRIAGGRRVPASAARALRDHYLENNKASTGNTFTAYLVVQILSTKNNYTRHGILVYGIHVLRKTLQTTATQARQHKTDPRSPRPRRGVQHPRPRGPAPAEDGRPRQRHLHKHGERASGHWNVPDTALTTCSNECITHT